MHDVFLINTSLLNDDIKVAINELISDAVVVYTSSVKEFIDTAKYYGSKLDVDTIYAVGGDGTVNLLASVLINANKRLGIVPIGHNNKIYKSIKNNKLIDIGYINDKLFLNHAIVMDTNFKLEQINCDDRNCFKELRNFEFATNAYGKYKIISANAIVISNGFFNQSECSIFDKKMETYFLQYGSNNLNKFLKNNRIFTNHFGVDLLGNFSIIIDGDLYSISKFDFNISNKQLQVKTKEINKQLVLVNN